jgi:hypothetical protein
MSDTNNQIAERADTAQAPVPVRDVENPLMDTDRFNHLWRVATAFAKSDMVPQQFRGKVENCFVALQFAMRANLDPFGFLQKCYVIQGRPGIEATLAVALLQNSGMIRGTVQYQFDGDKDDYGCTAYVTDASTGKPVWGPKVSWKVVKAEGWDKKNGSKWKTMSDMMFRYRAAMWLIRSNYPGVVLGLHSKDELDDMVDVVDAEYTRSAGPSSLDDVTKRLSAAPEPEAEPNQQEPATDTETPDGALFDNRGEYE